MNLIDAHKDELERLLVNLSRDAAVSGMAFVVLLDVYIRRLDLNCSDSVRALIRRRGKSTENQHGPRVARYTTRNIQLQKVAPHFPKFSPRSSQTRFIPFAADHTPGTRVRGWR
jgi:hypothetical protein